MLALKRYIKDIKALKINGIKAACSFCKRKLSRFLLSFSSNAILFPYSLSVNNSQKTSSAVPPGPPVYVDLAYVPNHCSAKNVDQEFFKRVRAAYYVVSGNDPGSGEPSRGVLDALLEGKAQWGSNLQVITL